MLGLTSAVATSVALTTVAMSRIGACEVIRGTSVLERAIQRLEVHLLLALIAMAIDHSHLHIGQVQI